MLVHPPFYHTSEACTTAFDSPQPQRHSLPFRSEVCYKDASLRHHARPDHGVPAGALRTLPQLSWKKAAEAERPTDQR
jgi:hypothetical protein